MKCPLCRFSMTRQRYLYDNCDTAIASEYMCNNINCQHIEHVIFKK